MTKVMTTMKNVIVSPVTFGNGGDNGENSGGLDNGCIDE
jgi:hypothetical protein